MSLCSLVVDSYNTTFDVISYAHNYVAGDGTHQAGGCSRALEMSNKWQVTDASLLRCCKMLKGAAQECDDRLHKCVQRILEVN